MNSIKKFLNDESGPTAVEYAVMVALIIVVAIGAVTLLGQKTSSTFNSAATSLTGSQLIKKALPHKGRAFFNQ